MMKRRIFKGMHYCLSFLNFKPYFYKKNYNVSYKVSFDKSCAYNIDTDQSDINKLFGFSYGLHHHQSDRIGWRYIPTENKRNDIEILLYSYENGVRYSTPITKITIGDVVNIHLDVQIHNGYRRVYAAVNNKYVDILLQYDKPLIDYGYTLGTYFGGNRTAPHTMTINIRKI
jgi:hypothetical protein